MNYKISQRAASLSPSLTLAIDAKAKAMKAAGEDVVGFGAGEPDFDTPQHIKDAAAKALAAGFTKYTPSSGIPELREAIADKFKRENGLTYKPSQIIVSCGGKHSCYNVILATCEAGDEVIIPAPYWLSYPEMVKLAGAKPVIFQTTDKTEFKVTPGAIARGHHAEHAAVHPQFAEQPDRQRLYAGGNQGAGRHLRGEKRPHHERRDLRAPALRRREQSRAWPAFRRRITTTPSSSTDLPKRIRMTGWRLGFLAAPEPIAKAIDAVQSHSTSNPTSFAQKGGVAALTGPQDHLQIWLAEFDKRRRYAHAKLNTIPGISCVNAKGAFYLFPNISKTGLKSADFCAKLLEQEKVAAVPGIAFGADDYIRLSYATSMANIEKGLDRMEKFCRTLVK